MNQIIEFEDTGQDFLKWIVSPTGEVLDCVPFQAWLWCEKKVVATQFNKAGKLVLVLLDPETKEEMVLKHAITSIRTTNKSQFHAPKKAAKIPTGLTAAQARS
ncbi:MAG: hypothetical protein COA69_13600 [Robiginitomaculum sp.]|nr:MAG: hypothetical protein COA69_13600 [Robiginitomaculum sp.]